MLFLRKIIPTSNMVVNSTEVFIARIGDIVVNRDAIMASLDIVSLFISIDTQEVV